ncbi:MAG: lysophospholipid acyltransferase family protein [Planctomycetota bacterium]|nr:lysophospholipid acyltransferase family protein [Planctomycetota bacterium]
MARNQPAIVVWSQYLALRAVAGFMHCFSVEQNLQTAADVGSLFYRFSPRHQQRAKRNIALSFPTWSAERVAEVAERSLRHMFQLFMVDAVIMPRRITVSSWPSYVRIGPLRGVMDRLVRGEPLIFLTGHFGNWELLGYTLAVIGYPLYALARPLDNPLLNRWVMDIREARGMRIITKWGATPILQGVLESGGRVAFIADQNAGDQGLFVPFFGRLASSYKSIGLLAMRYRVPIVAGFARRLDGRFKYELTCADVISPQDWVDQPDPLFYITARYNRAMEQMIRSAPDQYLWVHRRWKSRPRHERLGRPVPSRLIAKLHSLPWLTQTDIDLIVQRSNEAARERDLTARR